MSHIIPPPPKTISSLPSQAPADEETTAPLPSTGITLIVTNLPSESTSSAREAFENQVFPTIRDRFRANNADGFFPLLDMLTVTSGDTRQPCDYVFVSLRENISPVPRPDILQLLVTSEHTQDAGDTFNVSWTTGNGPDRCRRLFFKARDKNTRADADEDRPVIEAHFASNNITAKFGSITGNTTNGFRLSFDFPDEATTEGVLKSSVSANGHQMSISRPNFVKPLYGWDIVIIGCHGISQFRSAMDQAIRSVLGPNSISSSRMAMNGDAYIVVVDNWDFATTLLQSKIPHPAGVPTFVSLSDPMLLYYFNLNNCPSSPRFLQNASAQGGSSKELAALNAEIQDLKTAGLQMRTVIEAILKQQTRIMENVHETTRAFQTTLAYNQMQMTALMELSGLESHVRGLRSSYENKDCRMVIMGRELGEAWVERTETQLTEMQEEICQYEVQIAAAKRRVQDLSTAQMAALPPGAQTTAPPIGLPPAPSTHDEMETDPVRRSSRLSDPIAYPPSRCVLSSAEMPRKSTMNDTPEFPPGLGLENKASTHTRSVVHPFPHAPKISSFLLLLWLALSCASVASASSTFRTAAINTNGLANPMKSNAVSSFLSSENPHAWVVTETKADSPVASRIRTSAYKTYESVGTKTKGKSAKWGIILGVSSSLQSQNVPIPDHLRSRALCVDITLPTSSGKAYIHRLIGVYAPYDPGGNDEVDYVQSYWDSITGLCLTAPYSWEVLGDCNASLAPSESTGTWVQLCRAGRAISSFLSSTNGTDVWSLQGDNDAHINPTFKSYATGSQKILDRCLLSSIGILSPSIAAPKFFVPGTDHKWITSSFVSSPPPVLGSNHRANLEQHLSQPTLYPGRFCFPRKAESERFTAFREAVDDILSRTTKPVLPIQNDDAYETLFNIIGDALEVAGTKAFELPSPRSSQFTKRIRSPSIDVIVRESRRTNRIIAAARQGTMSELSLRCQWVNPYLQGFLASPAYSGTLGTIPNTWAESVHSAQCISFFTTIRSTC